MLRDKPQPIYLKNYTPPDYTIESVDLVIELGDISTLVTSTLTIQASDRSDSSHRPLKLHGEQLELVSIALNGLALGHDDYALVEEGLCINKVPESFTLEIQTRIKPQDNTALEGLYKSSDMFCTQCEAEGFRRITYYLDRPDVMARFSTTIIADKDRYPVLLSNGNPVDRGEFDNGRHWVKWVDPFRKPSYLFALVAGRLSHLEDKFITASGREVVLRIYVEPENIDKCNHAMVSLKKAMRWDEQTYGLEYDLDIYMIVAVGDFNMGAMENKGLNIFNTAYVLARPDTATDQDYQGIENVIAHEYFHNWTGNRVTCRDWFQLSLKEGLTVFRDQEFSADMTSRAVMRINDVRLLRTTQFQEDAGPMAHPVRPDSYIEINNFYTATVYNKGAEVIRMYQTLLGRDGFRRGMDLYFERHDGQAVTTDDFCAAMADANGFDFSQFKRWYSQAGTPVLKITTDYDAETSSLTLNVEQSCAPTPGQTDKQPFLIPLVVGLVDSRGRDIPLRLAGETGMDSITSRVLIIDQPKQSFRFEDITEKPVPSLLRGFSAPVKIEYAYSHDELAFLLSHDNDAFNRWEAGQHLACRVLLDLIGSHQSGGEPMLDPSLSRAFGQVLADKTLDRQLIAETLCLPSEMEVGERMPVIDVDAIHRTRLFVRRSLAAAYREALLETYHANITTGPYRPEQTAFGQRRLKMVCLAYLMELEEVAIIDLCYKQFLNADNMTDSIGALSLLAEHDCPQRQTALAAFYDQWRDDPLVLDKWFAVQACSRLPGTIDVVRGLLEHPAFDIKNPNKVRALLGSFCRANPVHFHAPTGDGYALLAEQILVLDKLNPQIAARLLAAFSRWRRFDPQRQQMMKQHLEAIAGTPGLSRDAYEIVSKSLVD